MSAPHEPPLPPNHQETRYGREARLLWSGVAVIVAAGLSLALRSPTLLQSRPLTEDGFFSLAVARQLATGHGLTIDGVHWVNGFQPLFTVLCAVPYLVVGGAPLAGLRAVLVLHALVLAGGAVACGLVARDAVADRERRALRFALGAAAYAFSPQVFLTTFNGLETGAVLALLAWTWRYWQQTRGETLGQVARTGALLGLLVLTRIDASILVVIVTAGQLWPGAGRAWTDRLQRAAAIALPAALVSAPWWTYNVLGFGHLMPTSGQALTSVGPNIERLLTMTQAVQSTLVPLTYAGRWDGLMLIPVRALLVAGIVWGVRRAASASGSTRVDAATRTFAVWISAALGVYVVYYVTSSGASWFYGRYLAGIAVPMSVWTAVALSSLGGWAARIRPLAMLACGAALVVAVVRLHTDPQFAISTYVEHQVALVESVVPADADVASGQTGTLGYFRARTINLDGKVNPDALRWKDDIAGYLARTHVTWFCDWPHLAARYLGSPPSAHGWEDVGAMGQFHLYHRASPPTGAAIDPRPALRSPTSSLPVRLPATEEPRR